MPSNRTIRLLLIALISIFYFTLTSHISITQAFSDHEIKTERFWDSASSTSKIESNGYIFYILRNAIVANLPSSPLSQRSLSIICGLLTSLGVGQAAYSLSGPKAALCSIFALSIHVGFLGYAAHDRFYSFNQAAIAWATCFLILASKRPALRWWIAYALALSLCAGTMLLSMSILLPHMVLFISLSDRSQLTKDCKYFIYSILPGILAFVLLFLRDHNGYGRLEYGPFSFKYLYHLLLCNGSYPYSLSLLAFFDYEPWQWSSYTFDWWSSEYWNCPSIIPTIIVSSIIFLSAKTHLQRLLLSSFLSIIALLIIYSLTVKNLLCNANYSWLIPLYALVYGIALSMHPRLFKIWLSTLLIVPGPFWWCTILGDNTINELTENISQRPGDLAIRLVRIGELPQRERLENHQPWRSPNWPQRWNCDFTTPQVMQCDSDIYAISYMRLLYMHPQPQIKRLWLLSDHLTLVDSDDTEKHRIRYCADVLQSLAEDDRYIRLQWISERLNVYVVNFSPNR